MNGITNTAGESANGTSDAAVRILRPIARLDDWPKMGNPENPGPTIAVVDTETDGLDPETDQVIEIAAALVQTDSEGRITGIIEKIYGLQDPGRPLPAKIKTLSRVRCCVRSYGGIGAHAASGLAVFCGFSGIVERVAGIEPA
ncbi:exonuclease domain-containing protein [Porphyrobacter sp. MBR-155]|uniref:exonuclease domain-containing protein n=1 Tax=Porphyrobacter sp. MBR-155 TaxID=3156464 RepID=UPI0033998665